MQDPSGFRPRARLAAHSASAALGVGSRTDLASRRHHMMALMARAYTSAEVLSLYSDPDEGDGPET